MYQWGRAADGHQCRNSATTITLSSTDQPGHGNFIKSNSSLTTSPFADWRSPQNTNLWQGVNGVNNPCPSGYRLPTETELNAERLSWSSNNASGAINSTLKLPLAGNRSQIGGLVSQGTEGYCWSSTIETNASRRIGFASYGVFMVTNGRSFGFSVRCIKN